MAGTPAQNGNNEAGNTDSSRKTEALCGKGIKGHGLNLAMWSTPRANKRGFPDAHGSQEGPAAGPWPTTTTSDGTHGGGQAMGEERHGSNLDDFAMLSSWATTTTTTTRDWRSDRSRLSSQELYGSKGQPLARQALYADDGQAPTGSSAETASGGQLNSGHSAWLMGLLPEWGWAADRIPKSVRRSKK
jgi:hypothetical protein